MLDGPFLSAKCAYSFIELGYLREPNSLLWTDWVENSPAMARRLRVDRLWARNKGRKGSVADPGLGT